MRNFCIVILVCICTITSSYGQFFQKENVNVLYSGGFHNGFSYANFLIDDVQMERGNLFAAEFEPYLGYYPINNLGIGISYSYEFMLSNIYEKDPFIEFGVFVRYYIPYVINKSFLRRIHLFSEFTFSRANYKTVPFINKTVSYKTWFLDENFIMSDRMDQKLFTIPIGVQLNVWKGLNIEISAQYMNFLNGAKYFKPRVGIEYHFAKLNME